MTDAKRIVHIYSSYKYKNNGDRKRHADASASWFSCYRNSDAKWVNVSVMDESLKRNASTVLGDKHALPFIRDYVDDGIRQAAAVDGDIVVVTNDDCGLADTATIDILNTSIGWGSRRDFMALPRRLTKESLAKGHSHPGCDLFFMPVSMWPKVRQQFPDMIHGREAWDLVMRDVLKKNGGREVFDCVGHAMHMAYWLSHSDDPSSRHNQKLAEKYRIENGLPERFGLL